MKKIILFQIDIKITKRRILTAEEAINYILNFAEEENNDSYEDLKDLVWEDIDMEVERDAVWGPGKK